MHKYRLQIRALLIVCLLIGCSRREQNSNIGPNITAVPFGRRIASQGKIVPLQSHTTGVQFEHEWHEPADWSKSMKPYMAVGGVAVGDFNGDGFQDMYLTKSFGGNRLYRNIGGFSFRDVTSEAGLQSNGFCGTGATFVDIDNDGDEDLFACGRGSPCQLFVNSGEGRFVEKAADFGLDFNGATIMVAFADYDLDGDLDAYLLTHRRHPDRSFQRIRRVGTEWHVAEEDREFRRIVIDSDGKPSIRNAGQLDRLFRNDGIDEEGNLQFVDVTTEAKVDRFERGQFCTWIDFDQDRYPDLMVVNADDEPVRLWRNQRDGTFEDQSEQFGPQGFLRVSSLDFADMNADGYEDLLVSGFAENSQELTKEAVRSFAIASQNALVLANQKRTFGETRSIVSPSLWNEAVFVDLDSDGVLDIFGVGGSSRNWRDPRIQKGVGALAKDVLEFRHVMQSGNPQEAACQILRNTGAAHLNDVTSTWLFGEHECVGLGLGVADFDNDGDIDLAVSEFGGGITLFRNDRDRTNNVQIKLVGSASNRFGIGAKITLVTNDGTQFRTIRRVRGRMSTGTPMAHFGVGDAEEIEKLEVRWPSGKVQSFESLPVNQFLTISEPDGSN